jgi:1-deoxy-D-xylulose-5-phosphate synthase
VRYPRGKGIGVDIPNTLETLPIGKAAIRRSSAKKRVVIFAFGTLLNEAVSVAEDLDISLIDMRFVKPIDEACIQQFASSHDLIVTLEENCIMGGAGSAVTEFMQRQNIVKPVLQLGLPDSYIDHGKHSELLHECKLNSTGIQSSIEEKLNYLS